MEKFDIQRAKEILEKSKGKAIAVIGDIMLDRYFWGNVSRISPEAPVPVVDIERESYHLGGAANVANNLKSLGIEPILCGLLGDDNSGKLFSEIAENQGISSIGFFTDKDRTTTVKTRVIGNNQQLVRLDRETRKLISSEGEKFILRILNNTTNLSGIIFQDYNKGTISEFLILEVISFAKSNNIPVFVDPKSDNFFNYKEVTVFKPNRKEASHALNMNLRERDILEQAGKTLLERLNAKNVLITLGADGMILFESNGNISSVPTRARNIADVSGAGDTTIATLATAFVGGATIKDAASMANFAAGVVCEEPGIVPITIDSLLKSIKRNSINNG